MTARSLRSPVLAALVLVAVALVAAQAAVAQSPPTEPPSTDPAAPVPTDPTTPPVADPTAPAPAPTTPADVSVSVIGEGGILNGGGEYGLDVFVANFGPGTAANVRVALDLPKEIEEDEITDLPECRASGDNEPGTAICELGDLPPADKRQLRLEVTLDSDEIGSGERERSTATVSVLSLSPDPEPDNNSAAQRITSER